MPPTGNMQSDNIHGSETKPNSTHDEAEDTSGVSSTAADYGDDDDGSAPRRDDASEKHLCYDYEIGGKDGDGDEAKEPVQEGGDAVNKGETR